MTLKQAKNLCADLMIDLVFDHVDFSDKYVSNKEEKREQMKDCFLADVINSHTFEVFSIPYQKK